MDIRDGHSTRPPRGSISALISLISAILLAKTHLNFAYSDKMPILLHNISSLQWMAVFEPGEGGRWDPCCGAFQLQGTVDRYRQLFGRAGAGNFGRFWGRKPTFFIVFFFSVQVFKDCILNKQAGIAEGLPSTVRLKLFVLLPAWLLATQL